MSVAVLERKVNTEEEDKLHNSQISEQYKKLIDPESTLLELLAKSAPVDYDAEFKYGRKQREHGSVSVHTREPERTYRVENARADSELFRADSPINRKAKAIATEEEENEDLRPTQTTIKYGNEAKAVGKGKIETNEKKATGLTKRDKLIIAVACTVIIALFVLIIVNSAIISSLNSEISVLQDTLNQAQATYSEVLAEKNSYLDEGNLYQVVSDFATNNGMVLR